MILKHLLLTGHADLADSDNRHFAARMGDRRLDLLSDMVY